MGNDANVEALTGLLSDYIMGSGHGTDLDNIHLAEWLAARGVLVPSVLNVSQVAALYDVPEREEIRAYRVADLERVARGEFRTAAERIMESERKARDD